MPAKLLHYSGLVTKTRSMSGSLLTKKELEQLSELPTVNEAIQYLRGTKGYGAIFQGREEISHRGQAEAVITDSLYRDFERLYRFADASQRKPFQYIFFRYEVDLLKNCLKYFFHEQHQEKELFMDDFFERHTSFSLEGLKKAGTLKEFEQSLLGTKYERIFLKLHSGGAEGYVDYAMALDIYYYTTVYRDIRRSKRSGMQKLLLEVYGTQIDWLNLMWIYRSIRFYNQSQAEIFASLIPAAFRLQKKELRRMTGASDLSEFLKLFAQTSYFTGKDALIKMEDEISYRKVVEGTYCRMSRKYPMSMAPVLKYLYEKEQEIDRLTSIIEGIRYQVPPREIRDIILLTI